MKLLISHLGGRPGGINSYIIRMLECLENKDCEIGVLCNKRNPYIDELALKYSIKVHEIPRLIRPLSQFRSICKLISDEGYDTTYFNISEAEDCVGLLAAKAAGVKRNIVHCHSTGISEANPFKRYLFLCLHTIAKPVVAYAATDYVACAPLAAKWMFLGKTLEKAIIIYNSVHTEEMLFDQSIREEVREELGLQDKFVLGNVAMYTFAKNKEFLFDIFYEFQKKLPSAVLLDVGGGPQLNQLKQKAVSLGIAEKTIFLGERNDVSRLLQAMDFFVFPSRFEGQPVVAIEAQASGLKIIAGQHLDQSIAFGEQCLWQSLDESASDWADRILSAIPYQRYEKNDIDEFLKKFSVEVQNEKICEVLGF